VWVGYPHKSIPMTNVHGIKVAGATFPAQIWHDYMKVAKDGFCGKFPKPAERAELKPFCGRLSATSRRRCELPPVEGTEQTVPQAPVEATGGTQQETGTEPAPVPIPDTTVVGGPPPQTAARSAVFRFKSQGAASKGYQCSIDGGPFASCKSPATYSRLSPGQHVFSVRALSPAGDPDASPATFQWTVFEDLVPQSAQPQQTTTQAKPKPKPKPQPAPPILVG
jgi:membrane peptidoglycan carboxypeptidase